jgi:hypothetical protein
MNIEVYHSHNAYKPSQFHPEGQAKSSSGCKTFRIEKPSTHDLPTSILGFPISRNAPELDSASRCRRSPVEGENRSRREILRAHGPGCHRQ